MYNKSQPYRISVVWTMDANTQFERRQNQGAAKLRPKPRCQKSDFYAMFLPECFYN